MNFRSIGDLDQCIIRNLYRVPRDIDLVVGVPRSGMLPATLLALYLEVPLADLEGFLAGRQLSSGWTRSPNIRALQTHQARKVLVVDDSANTGTMMRDVRNRLAAAMQNTEFVYAAVYASKEVGNQLDLFFEVCPVPRVFEWNFMHHSYLSSACVDIDGVLCEDPSEDDNDDGERYIHFLENAAPRFIPRVKVGHIVSSRLAKYRPQTEFWLRKHDVEYGTLTMMPLASKEERVRLGNHARFKAEAMLQLGGSWFVESSLQQAREIALRTGRPVICTETMAQMPTSIHAVGSLTDAQALAGATFARIKRITPRKVAWRLNRLLTRR